MRYFLGFAILFIALVTGYVFYITHESYTLTNELFVPFSLTLPIAVWVLLPLAVLFILTWLFMVTNALVIKFKSMSFNRDVDKILSQFEEQMLGNAPRDRVFANSRFKEISKTLKRFYILPNLNSNPANVEKIDNTFATLVEIKNGNFAPKIKLQDSHPLYKKNLQNAATSDAQKAFNNLKSEINKENIAQDIYTESSDVYTTSWDTLIREKNAKLLEKALNLNSNFSSHSASFENI